MVRKSLIEQTELPQVTYFKKTPALNPEYHPFKRLFLLGLYFPDETMMLFYQPFIFVLCKPKALESLWLHTTSEGHAATVQYAMLPEVTCMTD